MVKAQTVRRLLRIIYIGGTSIALAAVFAIPYLRDSQNGTEVIAGTVGHLAIAPFCHQLPERCFRIGNTSMPLCARCFGVLSGTVTGILLYAIFPINDLSRLQKLFFGASLIIGTDWILNVLHLYKIDSLRCMTGLILGIVTTQVIMYGIGTIVDRDPTR